MKRGRSAEKGKVEARAVQLEEELARLRGDLEVKSKDFESQREEVERLRKEEGRLEQVGLAGADRLLFVARALAGKFSIILSNCVSFLAVL